MDFFLSNQNNYKIAPYWFFLFLVLFLIQPNVSAEERRLVLVTGSNTQVSPLDLSQLRRLFLGLPIYISKHRLHPVRNMTDPVMYEVFLQKVIYMSSNIYENQLINRSEKKDFDIYSIFDADNLISNLLSQSGSITYMWEMHARQNKHLKIIQTLWSEQK